MLTVAAMSDERRRITELQRARILEAMTEIVAERGLHGTTIAAVTKKARVSRQTFTDVFGSVEQAFVALVEQVTEWPASLIAEAFQAGDTWRASILAGLEALLVFLDAEPALARVCVIDALAGPQAALEHRARLLQPLITLVNSGRDAVPRGRQPPPITAEAVVVSVAGMLHARMVTHQVPPFTKLLGDLAEQMILPFLGAKEAAEAAKIGNRRAHAIARERFSRPPSLRVPIPKQLHHARASRARACVLYLAENPGASNRTIATGIGIRHLGQASTMLARLEEIEVLTKRTGGAGRPNAWRLSSHGEEVARSLMRH